MSDVYAADGSVWAAAGAVIFLWPNYIWNSGRSNHDCITKSCTFRYSWSLPHLIFFTLNLTAIIHCTAVFQTLK